MWWLIWQFFNQFAWIFFGYQYIRRSARIRWRRHSRRSAAATATVRRSPFANRRANRPSHGRRMHSQRATRNAARPVSLAVRAPHSRSTRLPSRWCNWLFWSLRWFSRTELRRVTFVFSAVNESGLAEKKRRHSTLVTIYLRSWSACSCFDNNRIHTKMCSKAINSCKSC